MTWTSEKTWAVGDVFTSSDANQFIRDDLQWGKDTVRQDILTKEGPAAWNNAASNVYADYGGAGVMQITNWVKRQGDTDIRCRYLLDGWVTGVAGQIFIGMKVGATDYGASSMFYNLTGTRQAYGGHVVASGLAAGTYTVTLRMRSFTATCTYNTDTQCGMTMQLYEGSPVT